MPSFLNFITPVVVFRTLLLIQPTSKVLDAIFLVIEIKLFLFYLIEAYCTFTSFLFFFFLFIFTRNVFL